MQEVIGNLDGRDIRVGVVQARFNPAITGRLWARCLTELMQLGVDHDDIVHVTVPGALEIPFALSRLGLDDRFDVMIAIGCVVRGDTYHFEVVSNESARGILDVSLSVRCPIVNLILTTDNDDQAIARINQKAVEAARTAIEMAAIDKQLLAVKRR